MGAVESVSARAKLQEIIQRYAKEGESESLSIAHQNERRPEARVRDGNEVLRRGRWRSNLPQLADSTDSSLCQRCAERYHRRHPPTNVLDSQKA